MYFDPNQILECKQCNQRLDNEPKFGQTVCSICVSSLTKQLNNNQYDCSICNIKHLMNDLPINNRIKTIKFHFNQ